MPDAQASGFPSPSLASSNDRGGQAPALREHQAPRSLLPNTSKYETPSVILLFSLQKAFNLCRSTRVCFLETADAFLRSVAIQDINSALEPFW